MAIVRKQYILFELKMEKPKKTVIFLTLVDHTSFCSLLCSNVMRSYSSKFETRNLVKEIESLIMVSLESLIVSSISRDLVYLLIVSSTKAFEKLHNT